MNLMKINHKKKISLKLMLLCLFASLNSITYAVVNESNAAITKSISITQLQGNEKYSPITRHLVEKALELTRQNLTYTYGSANPKNGGMDCSGTIYFLLKSMGIHAVPRQGNEMYLWVMKQGKLHAIGSDDLNSAEFSQLKPGDLLFWSGTYQAKRSPPITHVMLYLGKNKQNQPLMFGASNGRPYQGKSMWGVSVFDFNLPAKGSASRFEGYSCIPQLTCSS